MALTLAPKHEYVVGDRLELVIDITFDNSYPTGGLALTPANLGFTELDVVNATPDTAGHTFPYDYTNQKLMAFSGGSQVANTTDLHTTTTRVVARGKGFPITGV